VRLPGGAKEGISFVVRTAAQGTNRIGLRYARGSWFDAGSGFLNLYVNGEFVKTVMLPEIGSWENWRVLPALVDLREGDNTIEYRNDYGDFGACLIDQLQVTLAKGAEPDKAGKAQAKPEATPLLSARRYDAALAVLGGKARLGKVNAGYSGDGYAQFGPEAGQSATFDVEVAESGNYPVTARYCFPWGWAHKARTLTLAVNGEPVKQCVFSTFRMANSQDKGVDIWGYGRWGLNVENVYLKQGKNTITYKVSEGDTGNLNLDAILISNRPEPQDNQ
jgi:hypothetical protein